MQRQQIIDRLNSTAEFDLAIIGGGATGLGIAVEATARGFKVALFEAKDFAKGTSSRSTKIIHGGVRYLEQGNIKLVREALCERESMINNAPHIAEKLSFVIPSYSRWQKLFYGVGLVMYDLLSGKTGLGKTDFLTKTKFNQLLAGIKQDKLVGGIRYWDGQFDDARFALTLAATAESNGAVVLNHAPVEQLLYQDDKISGLIVKDKVLQQSYQVKAKAVINATGIWVDKLRQDDGQYIKQPIEKVVTPSQGIHLVLDKEFLPGNSALMIPKTTDGRVLFAIPWLGKVILGTTDTAIADLPYEPKPQQQEIDFLLNEIGNYLVKKPSITDVKSIWCGVRPLVRSTKDGTATKTISREHSIFISNSGLLTITGGKWTTYRSMAEDALNHIFQANLLPKQGKENITRNYPLFGAQKTNVSINNQPGLHIYGSNANKVTALPGADIELGFGLTEAMVRYAVQQELAISVEDVLARRSRLLFLDAKLALAVAPRVAEIISEELNHTVDVQLTQFIELAQSYTIQ